jgi:type I restriction enzyme, S subunit
MKKRLDELCEVFVDGDWIESKDQSPEGIRLVQTGNIGVGEYKDKSDKARYVSQSTFDRLKCTEVVPGDCLVSRLPEPVGRACIVPDVGQRMITGVDCSIIRFRKDEMEPEFFTYYSQASEYLDEVAKLITGTTRDRISRSNLGSIPIPVPPKEVRQRIVAKLDAAFGALREAEGHVERNRANARELFESYLNGVFEGGEIDADLMRLGDVCKTGSGSTPLRSRKDYYEGGKVPWLLSGEVAQGEVTKATNFITELALKETSVKMFPPGTVLVAMYGATAGEVGILRFPSTTNQAVCGIHPSDQFIPEYLYFVFLHKKAELVAQAVGGAQPNISQEKIKNTLIPVPTIKQQTEVVKRLEAVRHQASQLEATYQQKLRELEGLKKGLLGAAFRGEL